MPSVAKTTLVMVGLVVLVFAAISLRNEAQGMKEKVPEGTALKTIDADGTPMGQSQGDDNAEDVVQKRQEKIQVSKSKSKRLEAGSIQLDDFRLCRIKPFPVLGEDHILMPGLGMNLTYQCGGDNYNRFANLLEDIIRNKAAEGYKWGLRDTILPGLNSASSRKERAILIMGNSHTRQLASALLCQYKDQVIDTKFLHAMPKYPQNGVLKIEMKNNFTVYSATNIPFVYSHEWHKILEDSVLKRKLSTLDAIVMGRFNSFSDGTGTNFHKMMMEYQQQYPDLNMDFENIPGPTVKQVAKRYKGPIIYVSMFAKYGVPKYKQAKKEMDNLQKNVQRTNLKYIHGRRYVAVMEELQGKLDLYSTKHPPVHECSTDDRFKVSSCVTNVTDFRFANGHRCMGSRGGHPDLVAWDVVTALHKMVPNPNAKKKASRH